MGTQVGSPRGYQAARESAAFFPREERAFFSVQGKAAPETLRGILSGRIPPPLRETGPGALEGEAPYSAILTPKGKMVTDLRVLPDPAGGFLLELPGEGREGALAHFGRYMNPRFAQMVDRTGELGQLTLVGPGAGTLLAGILGGGPDLPPRDHLICRPAPSRAVLWGVGNGDVELPAVDIILPVDEMGALRGSLEGSGVSLMEEAAWETLRIEAGTPRFGKDMTTDTIPVEAEIHQRAIDHGKGCYTGQEVIVRIRDRGQVARKLRRISLGSAPVPSGGDELFGGDGEKGVGWITSACHSPRFGETLAMGMIRRGVEVGAEVRVGTPQGPLGRVMELKPS